MDEFGGINFPCRWLLCGSSEGGQRLVIDYKLGCQSCSEAEGLSKGTKYCPGLYGVRRKSQKSEIWAIAQDWTGLEMRFYIFGGRKSYSICHQHAWGQQKWNRRHKNKAEGTCHLLTRLLEEKFSKFYQNQKAKVLSHNFHLTRPAWEEDKKTG